MMGEGAGGSTRSPPSLPPERSMMGTSSSKRSSCSSVREGCDGNHWRIFCNKSTSRGCEGRETDARGSSCCGRIKNSVGTSINPTSHEKSLSLCESVFHGIAVSSWQTYWWEATALHRCYSSESTTPITTDRTVILWREALRPHLHLGSRWPSRELQQGELSCHSVQS